MDATEIIKKLNNNFLFSYHLSLVIIMILIKKIINWKVLENEQEKFLKFSKFSSSFLSTLMMKVCVIEEGNMSRKKNCK